MANFGSGITLASAFDLGAALSLDSRYICEDTSERDAHVTSNRAYEGMLCYVKQDKTIYRYNGSTWDTFGKGTITAVSVSGDVNTTEFTTGGAESTTVEITLKTITEGGTHTKITYNEKGLVTSATDLSAEDIPDLTLAKITDAGSAASKNAAETGAGNVLVIGADGKISADVIPSMAITEVFPVENQGEMLGLNAQPGDIAIRNDESKTYILKQSPASELGNWVEMKTPTIGVTSINGKSGAVTLTTKDIAEDTNLYYTEERATQNFSTNIAKTSSTQLIDGADLFHKGDNLAATQVTTDESHQFVTNDQLARIGTAVSIIVGEDPEGALATMKAGDFYYEVTQTV